MRITSGKFRSRVIKLPKKIRPTQDKVRKALFDILGDIEGLSFLELYAGSGAVGLEAASRGASELTLIESDPECALAITQNIDSLKLASCKLYRFEAQKAIQAFHRDKRAFDLIFMDPPYYNKGKVLNDSLAKKTLQMLGAYDILAPNGLLVVQHFKKDDLPEVAGDLRLFRQSRYGDTVLSFYRKN